jgi:hypothetical protein
MLGGAACGSRWYCPRNVVNVDHEAELPERVSTIAGGRVHHRDGNGNNKEFANGLRTLANPPTQ